MKRLMLSGLTLAALVAVATGAMRSHSRPIGSTTAVAGMQSSLDLAASVSTSGLPVEEVDDRSLVFTRDTAK